MKNIVRVFVAATFILGAGTAAYALDTFILSNTTNEGLNGAAMAVTPNATNLANAAVPPGGPTDASALAMMPNGGAAIETPGSGLTTNFNQTGVANAFGYGIGIFQFPAGSTGDGPFCASCPAPPEGTGGGTGTVDQLVSKYTAGGGFAQNFHDVFKQGTLSSPGSGGTTGETKLTLEQGDTDPNSIQPVFKTEVASLNGASNGLIAQLVQQNIDGPFSSCINCLDPVIGPIPITQRTDSGPNFIADTVSHPGP